MILEDSDLLWLRGAYPSLSYDPSARVVSGEIDFCAWYDVGQGLLRRGGGDKESTVVDSDALLCDVFAIRIELDTVAESAIDWPAVYESGGRCASIAATLKAPVEELHVNSDGSCCLGIQVDPGPNCLERFIDDLVVPFFFRVAYVERFGVERARRDLWGEHRHGTDGLRDRLEELSAARTGRNRPCSCGSGKKYKACCLRVNEDRLRSLRERLAETAGGDGPRQYGHSRAARRGRSNKT